MVVRPYGYDVNEHTWGEGNPYENFKQCWRRSLVMSNSNDNLLEHYKMILSTLRTTWNNIITSESLFISTGVESDCNAFTKWTMEVFSIWDKILSIPDVTPSPSLVTQVCDICHCCKRLVKIFRYFQIFTVLRLKLLCGRCAICLESS